MNEFRVTYCARMARYYREIALALGSRQAMPGMNNNSLSKMARDYARASSRAAKYERLAEHYRGAK